MKTTGSFIAVMSMMFAGDVNNVFAGTRYVYVQTSPAPQNRGLEGVERVMRDMAALRPGTASRSLTSEYHNDLDARLRALESKNNVKPRAIGPVGATVLTEVAVSAAADILGALNLHKNSSDQVQAQAILEALIPHIQQVQQAASANAVPQKADSAVPGPTKAEVEFVQALSAVTAAAKNAQKDADAQSKAKQELHDTQKKLIEELIIILKKIP